VISPNDIEHITQPYILNGFNQTLEHKEIIGTLSVKCMFNGRATYCIEGAHLTVDDSCFMILNHAQPYDMIIDALTAVESFCVFLPQSWLSDVYRNITLTDSQLLSNPYDNTQPFLFFEMPHDHDNIISPFLFTLRQHHKTQQLTSSQLVQYMYQLIPKLIKLQQDVTDSIADSFLSVRVATRIELYRRLHLTREYILSNLHRDLTLDQLAQVACMSPYHFLRRFTELFQITPHQFIMQQRLNRAEILLTTTKRSVTDICIAVGFSSLGSFSTLFQREYGVSPRAYRTMILQS